MPDTERHSEGLMTVADVVKYTQLSESTIRNHVTAGTIPVARIGRRLRFRRAEIDAWIDAHAEPVEPAPVAS